ncbi:MAG: hypothetical protein E7066_08430 [Lentimicrobiaceae bacterium]|nr:hypothetical protein [Lentimicrobiaceae bacterium]
MKKLSLTNLSKTNLSKMQEQAITGGSSDSCICAALCTSCSCRDDDSAERTNDESMDSDLENCVDENIKGDIM